MGDLQIDAKDMMEALSAQRNEAHNSQAMWFAKFMAATKRIKELEDEVAKLKPAEVPAEPAA